MWNNDLYLGEERFSIGGIGLGSTYPAYGLILGIEAGSSLRCLLYAYMPGTGSGGQLALGLSTAPPLTILLGILLLCEVSRMGILCRPRLDKISRKSRVRAPHHRLPASFAPALCCSLLLV